MDFEHLIISILVLSVVGLGAGFLLGDKHVRGYYLGSANESNLAYCISADITWSTDPVVYCSDDISKTLEVYNRLK